MTQALVNPTVSVGIGCSKANNGTVIKTFNGFLGRWGIYDRVLAADEVRSLYDNPDQVWSQNARPRFYFASATTQTTPFSFCWV